MSAVTYDTGALTALDSGDPHMVAVHSRLQSRGLVPVVPAGVLARVWFDGTRQVQLGLALRGCRVEVFDAYLARRVGELRKALGLTDIVDLTVAVCVLSRGGVVYSSDPEVLPAYGVPRASIQRV